MTIKIDPELKALIPPLATDEYKQLEANIIAEGCRDPLVVWDGTLIDGHNRHEICTRHGIKFDTVEKQFDSMAYARIWMRNNQKGRRNLTPAWHIEMELGNKADLLEIGKKTQGRRTDLLSQNDKKLITIDEKDEVDPPAPPTSTPKPVNTRVEIAKAAGVSTGQVGMAEQLKKKAPDLWEKAKAGEVSISTAYKKVQAQEKIEKRHEEFTKQSNTDVQENKPTIELADCIEWIAKQKACDLILTDPPYSTDVDDINAFAESWLPLALAKLKSTGRAYIFVGAYPEELAAYMRVAMPTQILVWEYRNTIGPSPSHGYKLNWQAILYYQGEDAPRINCPIMLEQFSVQHINAPDGRLGDRYHAWQKPMQIGEQFVRHATKQGDTVLDPFSCTGTFLLAAAKLGRIAKGCDINAENIEIAIKRGCTKP